MTLDLNHVSREFGVMFHDKDRTRIVVVPWDTWDTLGRPTQVSVTVTAGV